MSPSLRLGFACACALAIGCDDGERSSGVDAGPRRTPALVDPPTFDPVRTGPAIPIGERAAEIPGVREEIPDDGSVPGRAGNRSFDTALLVEVDGTPPIADEFHADQADYFRFSAKAGKFYEISTEHDRFTPDNVITLYDAQRNPVGSNDTGSVWPGDKLDARLVVRAPADGDYYVKVEDLSTPEDFFSQPFALLYYHLTVRTLSSSTPGYMFWDGGTEPATFAQDDAGLGYRFVTVVGTFDRPLVSIPFTGSANTALIGRVHPGGMDGNGSTVSDGLASVSLQTGALSAVIDRSQGRGEIRPPLKPADYRFELGHTGPAGDNAFFAVDMVLLADNPREVREADNGVIAGAEVLSFSQGTRGRALLLAELPQGDVDYYRIPVEAGQYVGVVCDGRSTGSGVRGLAAELRNAADQPVTSTVDNGGGVDLSNIVGETGNYYLRLSSGEAAAEAVEPWLRCVVVVG